MKINIKMPPDRVPGVYADFVSLWHTQDVFTFDFAALEQSPKMVEDEQGNKSPQAEAQIVARVRIPPGQLFEIMKAMEKQLTAWEKETGGRPQAPPPPDDGFPFQADQA